MSIDNATPEEWDAIVQAHHAGVVAQGDDKSDHLLRRLNAALEKPFGEVPIYWRCLAFGLWQQGHPVEFISPHSGRWMEAVCPTWEGELIWRVLPKPEELVLPSIDWSHVGPKWKWLAQDQCGGACLTTARPRADGEEWLEGCDYAEAHGFASFNHGKGDWTKLIVQRPEGA